jgi:hypothetical protein
MLNGHSQKQRFTTSVIPVRRGQPLRAKAPIALHDGRNTSLSHRLGKKLTGLAGPTSMIPGLSGQNSMIPGLSSDGMLPDMGGLAGTGVPIKRMHGRLLRGARPAALPAAPGRMLPGLSEELADNFSIEGELSADEMYQEDQVDGVGEGTVLGMDPKMLMLAGGALVAFFLLSGKRRRA